MIQNHFAALEVLIWGKEADDAFQHIHRLQVALQIFMGTPQYRCLSLKHDSKRSHKLSEGANIVEFELEAEPTQSQQQ